jgi:hypothetical protein
VSDDDERSTSLEQGHVVVDGGGDSSHTPIVTMTNWCVDQRKNKSGLVKLQSAQVFSLFPRHNIAH